MKRSAVAIIFCSGIRKYAGVSATIGTAEISAYSSRKQRGLSSLSRSRLREILRHSDGENISLRSVSGNERHSKEPASQLIGCWRPPSSGQSIKILEVRKK